MARNPRNPATELNLHIYPSTLVGASRVFKIAQSLQSGCGFLETHVVGVASGAPSVDESIPRDVRVVRIRGSAAVGMVGRILKVLLWQPRVYWRYRNRPIASIAAHNVWVLPLCTAIALRTRAVLVYNAHELETETIAMFGLKRQMARLVERSLIHRARVVSTVNGSIAEWYRLTYGIDRPIDVTNVPLDSGISANLRGKLGIGEDEMVYIHTGHLTYGRNLPLILETFASHTTAHVVLLGDGPLLREATEFAKTYPNIHIPPPTRPDDVVAHVRGADVSLCLIETTSLSLAMSSPNKLFEGLCAGTPVLATALNEVRRILGPLAADWIDDDPVADLAHKIIQLDKSDVAAFRAEWQGVPPWDEQVAPLIAAYRQALGLEATPESVPERLDT